MALLYRLNSFAVKFCNLDAATWSLELIVIVVTIFVWLIGFFKKTKKKIDWLGSGGYLYFFIMLIFYLTAWLGLESLPVLLQRHYSVMRDLDDSLLRKIFIMSICILWGLCWLFLGQCCIVHFLYISGEVVVICLGIFFFFFLVNFSFNVLLGYIYRAK